MQKKNLRNFENRNACFPTVSDKQVIGYNGAGGSQGRKLGEEVRGGELLRLDCCVKYNGYNCLNYTLKVGAVYFT